MSKASVMLRCRLAWSSTAIDTLEQRGIEIGAAHRQPEMRGHLPPIGIGRIRFDHRDIVGACAHVERHEGIR